MNKPTMNNYINTNTSNTKFAKPIRVANPKPRLIYSDIVLRQAIKAEKQKARKEVQRNRTIERNFVRDDTLEYPLSELSGDIEEYDYSEYNCKYYDDDYHSFNPNVERIDPQILFSKKKVVPIFQSSVEHDEKELEQERIRAMFDFVQARLDEHPMRCLGYKSNCCNCIECCNV